MSADWGQNDGYWDTYGRYSGEYNGIKIAATTGWSHDNTVMYSPDRTDPVGLPAWVSSWPTGPVHLNGCSVGYWQSGIYVEHVATAVFVYGAYGQEFLDTFVWPSTTSQTIGWSRPVCVSGGTRSVTRSSTASYAQRNDMFNAGTVSGVRHL